MDLNNILRLINNFFHMHPLIALGIVIGLALILWLKPKEAGKVLLLILAVALAAYILYYLGHATLSGMSGKEKMLYE